MKRLIEFAVALCLALVPAWGQGILIPIPERTDHVFDPIRRQLYVARSDGLLDVWDPVSQTVVSTWSIGNSLAGLDILADGSALFVGEANPPGVEGIIYRIDLPGGSTTPFSYPRGTQEAGVQDLAVASNGLAMFVGPIAAVSPIREIDLASGAISVRAGPAGSLPPTQVGRGGSHDRLLFSGWFPSNVFLFSYNATTDTFGPVGSFFSMPLMTPTVSHDGRVMGVGGRLGPVVDTSIAKLNSFGFSAGPVIFHPTLDQVIEVLTTGSTRTFDTTDPRSFQLLSTVDLGEQPSAGISIASDGSLLFVSTATGIRMLALTSGSPSIASISPDRVDYNQTRRVTVFGGLFGPNGNAVLKFGGVAATSVQHVSDGVIECLVPPLPPGPVDVEVMTPAGSFVASRAFHYVPATLLGGDLRAGGTLEVTCLNQPGDTVLIFLGAGPTGSIPVPPFIGQLCISSPLLLAALPSWSGNSAGLALPIPNVSGLAGAELLGQALVGMDPEGGSAVFSNCDSVTLQ